MRKYEKRYDDLKSWTITFIINFVFMAQKDFLELTF